MWVVEDLDRTDDAVCQKTPNCYRQKMRISSLQTLTGLYFFLCSFFAEFVPTMRETCRSSAKGAKRVQMVTILSISYLNSYSET